MSKLDIALIVIIVLGAYSGYRAGFLMTLFSLLGILLGVLGGFKLMGKAMLFMAGKFNIDTTILPYFSFAVVFMLIVIIVTLVGRLLKVSIDKNFLGSVDQVLGALLGILKVTFMMSVIIWILDSMRVDMRGSWSENSWLYTTVAAFAPNVTAFISKFIPAFRDVFKQNL